MSDMKKLLEAMDSMNRAAKKSTGPKFPGYWKGTDPAAKAKTKMVGAAEGQHSFLKDLDVTAKKTSVQRRLKEEFDQFDKNINTADVIKMDVPLLIRIMEYAREDAKTDMDLHNVAENLIQLSQENRTLSMRDYDTAVAAKNEEPVTEYGNAQDPNKQSTTPGAAGAAQADNQNDAQSKSTDAAVHKNIAALKSIDPNLNIQQAAAAVKKTDIPNAQMTTGELAQAKKLTGLIEPAVSNPQLGPQITSLLNKAAKAEKVK